MSARTETELEIWNARWIGWRAHAVVMVVFAMQALVWITFGALLAHQMCRP
jgi:hypothetical protein